MDAIKPTYPQMQNQFKQSRNFMTVAEQSKTFSLGNVMLAKDQIWVFNEIFSLKDELTKKWRIILWQLAMGQFQETRGRPRGANSIEKLPPNPR